jgi:molybdate transport repressor ModE-like protein
MKSSMRFDLVDLRLFLFVTEAASITHGATREGMALASASERIRLMEESLGAPLLERHRRGVRATSAGAALVHHAQLVIQQLERMRGELSEYAEGFRGRVRLFANTTASSEFLPAAVTSCAPWPATSPRSASSGTRSIPPKSLKPFHSPKTGSC